MDLSAHGWLRNYCEKLESDIRGQEETPFLGYEEGLYGLVQPSGIMYGHPVKQIAIPGLETDRLDPVNRMKLIFTKSLINAGSLRLETSDTSIDRKLVAEQLIPEISDYFLSLYPNLYQGSSSSYLNRPYFLAENLIAKRLSTNTSLMKNYLANLFHNSLLFLDVYYFGEWVNGLGSVSTSQLRDDQARLRLTILGVMALAAKADSQLQREERALFEFFLQSAELSGAMQKEARTLLKSIGRLSDVDIPEVDSWLLRKYLLEMAVLVTLADREINEPELQFIEELGTKLKFSKEEVSKSMLAVESFVIDNWSAMYYLLGRRNLEKISGRFMVRLKGFVTKNKEYLVQEIRESKELFHLLGKSRTTTLTIEEKIIVNEQLIDILKTIPAFVIIALPFTFITLPTLLAILPKNAFPSSFQE